VLHIRDALVLEGVRLDDRDGFRAFRLGPLDEGACDDNLLQLDARVRDRRRLLRNSWQADQRGRECAGCNDAANYAAQNDFRQQICPRRVFP
jgi:hypothetical protein